VVWINTTLVSTKVIHLKPFWYWTSEHLPRNAVRDNINLHGRHESPVPLGNLLCRPHPAITAVPERTILVDLTEKSVSQWLLGEIVIDTTHRAVDAVVAKNFRQPNGKGLRTSPTRPLYDLLLHCFLSVLDTTPPTTPD